MSSSPPRATPFAAQYQGARRRQEDAFKIVPLAAEQSYLVLVADGMGGEAGGELASKTAVDSFAAAFQAAPRQEQDIPDRLRAAMNAANRALLDIAEQRPELEGMGTTLVAIVATASGLYYASVGDSPLWQVTGRGLRRINEDHSMRGALQELVRRGEMSGEAAARHPHRNQLRSALGQEELDLLDCPSEPLALGKSPMLVAATDGIETLADEEIHQIVLASNGDGQQTVQALLAAVAERDAPRQDNVTICAWQPELGLAAGGRGGAARREAGGWLLPAAGGALVMLVVIVGLFALFPQLFPFGGDQDGNAAEANAVNVQRPRNSTFAPVAPPEPNGVPGPAAVQGGVDVEAAPPAPTGNVPPPRRQQQPLPPGPTRPDSGQTPAPRPGDANPADGPRPQQERPRNPEEGRQSGPPTETPRDGD